MSKWQLVATTFVELADTIADGFEVLDFLQILADRAQEIADAAAAAVTLSDRRGQLQPIVSTDHDHRTATMLNLSSSAGPSLEVYQRGESSTNVSAAQQARRWPTFATAASSAGYGSVDVVPMRIRGEILGTLTVMHSRQRFLSADDQVVIEGLASVATIGLLRERTPRQHELIAERMQAALDQRVTIEQAKGAVAETLGIDVATAFELMKNASRRRHRALLLVSEQILHGDLATALSSSGGAEPPTAGGAV